MQRIAGIFSIIVAVGLAYAASGNLIQMWGVLPTSPEITMVWGMIVFQIVMTAFFTVAGIKLIRAPKK